MDKCFGTAAGMDRDMQMAIELSRRTFLEEQTKRDAESRDLMEVEDPAILKRNRQIEEIKRLLKDTSAAADGERSLACTNPFLPCPGGVVVHHPAVHEPHPLAPFGQSTTIAATIPALLYESPACCPPTPLPSCSVPTSPFFTIPLLASSQTGIVSSAGSFGHGPFPPVPDQLPLCGHFPLPSSSSACNPFISGEQITNSINSSNQQQLSLNTTASPLRIPFRQGDLIDLHSPRNARSMAIEEFDPLYKRLEQIKEIGGGEQEKPGAESSADCAKGASVGEEDGRTREREEEGERTEEEGNNGQTEEREGMRRRSTANKSSGRRRQKKQHRLLTCEDLKADRQLTCEFHKERRLLAEQCQRLALAPETNVLFLSPVLDYFVTAVDTIKLRVHQDDTWPRDTPEEPRVLELACGVGNSSEEILQDVLLQLLAQEEIARNEGKIPLGEYALKLFGTDELLVREAPIGKHLFVADYLAKGKDVELEVGKCELRQIPPPQGPRRRTDTEYPTVNEDLFNTFVDTFKGHVEKSLASPEDRKLRQPVVQSIKMITTFMNHTQPVDLVAAIDSFYGANSAHSLREAVSLLVSALFRLFRAYCRSSLTDFTIRDPMEQRELPADGEPMTTRDAASCNEKLVLSVESAHNLPGIWSARYKSFYLEAHLMYGPKCYGASLGSPRPLNTKHNLAHVPLHFWLEFDVHISSMPRECQICFVLRGVPIAEEGIPVPLGSSPNELAGPTHPQRESIANGGIAAGHGNGRHSAPSISEPSTATFARLASGSLPLYNVDGLLLQGPVLVALRQMEDDVVQPWGPRPLIRHPEDIVLMAKAVEFDYRIQFPEEIAPTEIHWRDFHSLSNEEQESLQTLIDGADCHQLGDSERELARDDRELLWSNRNCLSQFPEALPLVLISSFSWATYSLGSIYALLLNWANLSPMVSMELLLPYFQDKFVREKALLWIGAAPPEFLFNLICQFVEALRYETFENSALAVFLLEQATKNRRFALELYWQLQHRVHGVKNISYAARCRLLQQMLLDLRIPGFSNEVAQQHQFLDRLDNIANAVKANADSMMKTLQKELYQLTDELDMRNVRIPIAPSFQCKSIAVSECAIFSSMTKPIKLIVQGKRNTFGIIYKAGDDLRQDAVVLQLVQAMNDIWLREQLDLRIVLFRCLPTGNRKGLIELVPNCKTLGAIQFEGHGAAGVYKDAVLNNWLARQNPSEFEYKAALENFRRSCAGWCVATYVLGIGDRHNDNILVTTNGHVFHIDFGKYMGDWQMAAGFKRDRVPFVFTPEMAHVINGGGQTGTENFQRFVDECCQALNLLRKNCSMIVNIMRFLSCSDIPGMSTESVAFVEKNLMLDMSDVQATVLFTRMIEESLQSIYPRLNFFAHTLAQFKGNPLQLSGVTRAEDMNRLSFISEIYTEKDEGRIESVSVTSFEKWRIPEKVYMYKVLVKRVNENVRTQIFRSFPEFQELHYKLCFRFSSRAIPTLTRTVNVGRTNVQAVAGRRQIDLQYFLHRLFALSDEVAHSELIYTFLHPMHRDTEPETRKQNGMPDIYFDGTSQCQLLLRLSLDHFLSELRIFVGHAKSLPLVGREQAPDSYVKTYLCWGGNSTQKQKQWKRKTQLVRNAQNPTYNTEICYSLAGTRPSDLASLCLHVSIWHSGNAVLKDNFPLCDTQIQLSQLLDGCAPNRKGVKEMESWFTLTISYG